jgi:hypothetical protein
LQPLQIKIRLGEAIARNCKEKQAISMLSGYEKVTNVQYIPVKFLMKNIPAE